MRLVCIECNESIPAEKINVQDLVAVCPVCDAVFRFDLDEEKPKPRKIKAPQGISLSEDAPLHLTYEKVIGTERRATITGIGSAALLFTFILITTTGGFLAGDMPLIIPVVIGALWSMAWYTISMLYWTRTHIVYDGNYLCIAHQFLPHPLQEKEVNIEIGAIEDVYVEESYSSKRRGDAERTFHIYANTYNGGRVLLLKDIPEIYALYIEQEINAQVQALEFDMTSRLIEQDELADKTAFYDDYLAQAQES